MPIRNPFARRPGPVAVQDGTSRPGSSASMRADPAHPGFERVDTVGSKGSSAFSIRSSRKSQDTGEYKMSVVNDSGVYLPPSPIEKEATWPRRYLSRTSSDKSSVVSGEIEHFSISRESFDSYRRSFDICARSPVVITDPLPARQSLDSSRFAFQTSPRFPRSSLSDVQRRWDREPLTPEDEDKEEMFEDVGLTDNEGKPAKSQSQQRAHPRKRGFFAKFGSEGHGAGVAAAGEGKAEESGTAMSRFLPTLALSGRKQAPSVGQQGAELGTMPVVAGLDQPEGVESPARGLQAQEVEG
ncbi:hypothetical protein VTI74DRAFT_7300 [Chaetomium olivicolor]